MREPANPMSTAQRLARPEHPRRIYKDVTIAPHEPGFAVLLDGRPARTPARKALAVPTAALAEAVAAEWRAQGDRIEPASMPLTRLVNAAIDRVAGEMAAVRADIVKYAGSDLICYRADSPAPLVAAQDAHWGPLVAWAEGRFGVRLRLAAGIAHVAQDPKLAEGVAAAIAGHGPLPLAALHLATTLAGSAMIAVALAEEKLTPDAAWAAAQADEDWQMAQWGADAIALATRASRRHDFDAAALVLAAQ